MSRAELVAAVYAERPLTETWAAAVRRLGAWRKLEQERPKGPARRTGRDQYEQFYTVTKSHVFDADRETLRREFNYSNGTRRGQMIEEAQREVRARKQAEKQAAVAA